MIRVVTTQGGRMTDPNAPVRLRTGTDVPASAARTTYLALDLLANGQLGEYLALCEAAAIARDKTHRPFGNTGAILREMHLLDAGGVMHAVTRDVILAAVDGDEMNPRVVWPFDADADRAS
jgi:hypothetical protein